MTVYPVASTCERFAPITHPNTSTESMSSLPDCYGVIPARYASGRFEGKPLAPIQGKPMFWHVYNRACQCNQLNKVVLATDDERIFSAAKELGTAVLMTSNSHTCGTERVLEAAQKLQVPPDAVVINIQGDEPLLEPAMLKELLNPFCSDDVQVTTLAHEISEKEAKDPDQVKVVLANDSTAIYFSRSLIPYPRDEKHEGYLGHIGLYAFRMKALEKFVALEKGNLEKKEKLEQLRLLENGFAIHVIKTKYRSYGVDRPSDVAMVEQIMLTQQSSQN